MAVSLGRGDTRLIVDTCKQYGLLRNQCANVLAQARWETAGTMKPIREKGGEVYLRKKKYYPYVGMGYVQLTWLSNYQDWSKRLGVDFVANPKLLLKPEHAVRILVEGMKLGTFTGKKLADYLTATKSDHFNARAIVNGDKNKTVKGGKVGGVIAGYAREYDALLQADGYGSVHVAKPAEPKDEPRSQPNEFDSILHNGSRSQFVKRLQQNLNTLGYGPVMVDGRFGDQTETAVVAFQHDNGLEPDGWAGPHTLEAIGKAIKDRETAPKIAAAKDVVDDAASKGISKTEVITTVTGVGGVATVVKETVDSVKDGASSLLSLGPWILLALVIAGGAAFVILDRRRKRLAARQVQRIL